jgi:hypothetical protein
VVTPGGVIELHQRQLGYQGSLNANWHSLRISKFEYRLLHFFQTFCVPLFSFNVNPAVDRVWRHEVPKLWQQSDLVRQSIFLFSAINLWPLCGLDPGISLESVRPDELYRLVDLSDGATTMRKLLDGKSPSIMDDVALLSTDSLYCRTTSYFLRSVHQTNAELASGEPSIFSNLHEVAFGGGVQTSQSSGLRSQEVKTRHAEIVISGILLFSFLGVHPHRLVPLVAFDDGDASDAVTNVTRVDDFTPLPVKSDMLAICNGIHHTLIQASGILLESTFLDLFSDHERFAELPKNGSKYPLIECLKSCLSGYMIEHKFNELINAQSSEETEVFQDSVRLLEICLDRCVERKYPIPIFKWILAIDTNFDKYARAKNPIALKILYFYSALCILCRFLLFKESSIWLDYLQWYKDYNFKTYGVWLNSDDEFLYNLIVVEDYMLELDQFHLVGQINPTSMAHDNSLC